MKESIKQFIRDVELEDALAVFVGFPIFAAAVIFMGVLMK